MCRGDAVLVVSPKPNLAASVDTGLTLGPLLRGRLMDRRRARGECRQPNSTYLPTAVLTAIGVPLATAVVLAHAQIASAQTVTAQAVELPPVVVEGATLAKPKQKPSQPKLSAPAEEQEAASASPAKQPKKSASKKPAATAAPAGTAPASTPASPAPVPFDAAGPAVEASANGAGGDVTGVRADTVGTALTVVTADEIRAQQSRTAVDALRSLPGVSISQQGGPGTLAVARIRGAESNHTLVVIDGVEVNSGIDGFYDFSNLATDDIERIEVLRGPHSGIYGSGALGGVINIVTKSGKGPLRVGIEGESGSFDTKGGRVSVSGGTDTAWGAFMVSSRTTDGIDISPVGHERDGSKLTTVSLKAGVRPFENLTIHGAFRTSRLDSEYDNYDSLYDENFLPRLGFLTAVDADFYSRNEQWSGRLAADLSLFGDAWTQQVYVSRANRDLSDHSLDFNTFQIVDSKLRDDATTYGYKSTVRIGPKEGGPVRHFVTGLVEHRTETFDQPTSNNFHAERERTSFVGEVRGEYFSLLNLGATLRRDDNDIFDDSTDWRVDGSLKLPATPFRLHASYGTGTKLPSFAELYGKFSRYVANPDLKPERSKGWDAGIETTFLGGRGSLDVTYFKADLTDEITEDFSLFPVIRPINLDGASQRQGIEVAGRLAVVDGITVGAAYTWLDATDDKGKPELRRPEHQGRFDVDWRFAEGRARLNLAAIYNGRTPDFATSVVGYDTFGGFTFGVYSSGTIDLDSYWLLRLAGSYEIAPGLEVFGRVENLLDANYQEVFGYETAGLAAYAGLRLSLEAPGGVGKAWK